MLSSHSILLQVLPLEAFGRHDSSDLTNADEGLFEVGKRQLRIFVMKSRRIWLQKKNYIYIGGSTPSALLGSYSPYEIFIHGIFYLKPLAARTKTEDRIAEEMPFHRLALASMRRSATALFTALHQVR